MDMLLMGLCLGVCGVVFVALAFGAAMRSESWNSAVQPELPLSQSGCPGPLFLRTCSCTAGCPALAGAD